MKALPRQSNIIVLTMVYVSGADAGKPIPAGTVNFYLRANDGANAGKWYRGSDQSWQAEEAIAGVGTPVGSKGDWALSLPAGVWTESVSYDAYACESTGASIPTGKDIVCEALAGGASTAPTVEEIDTQLSLTHGAGAWGSDAAGTTGSTVTITVTKEGGDELEGIAVTLSAAAQMTRSAKTDADGVAVLKVPYGTWELNAYDKIYEYAGMSLAVAGTTAQAVEMTALAIQPAPAGMTTAWIVPLPNETIELRIIGAPAGSTGSELDGAWYAMDLTDGIATREVPQGARCEVRTSANRTQQFTASTTESTTPITSFVRIPA